MTGLAACIACSSPESPDLFSDPIDRSALTGIVHNRLLEPVQGAVVTIQPNGPTKRTDASGRFAFTLPHSPSVVLTIDAPGYLVEQRVVKEPALSGTDVVQLRARSSVVVELDTAHRGTQAILMSARHGTITGGLVKKDGRITFEDVPAGDYVLEVRGGQALGRMNLRVTEDATVHATLELVEPPLGGVDVSQFVDYTTTWHCIEKEGLAVEWKVALTNSSPDSIQDIVIADTLTGTFPRLLRRDDIAIDLGRFPGASVELGEDGRSFIVRAGALGAADSANVYRITLSLPSRGRWCNIVTVAGARDETCHAPYFLVQTGVHSWDGELIRGAYGFFDPAKEVFTVGEGASPNDYAFVYEAGLSNYECKTLSNLTVTATLEGDAVILRGPEPLFSHPVVSWNARRIVWNFGTYPPSSSGRSLVYAEAVKPGTAVFRVEAHSPSLPIPLVAEETTLVVKP